MTTAQNRVLANYCSSSKKFTLRHGSEKLKKNGRAVKSNCYSFKGPSAFPRNHAIANNHP